MSNFCQGCGSVEFHTFQNLSGIVPNVGDTYTFTIKYSDGTLDTGVTAAVSAFGNTSATVGPSDLATGLLPSGLTGPGAGTRATPTLSWTYPAGASTAGTSYQVSVCCGVSSDIWDVPNQNSNTNGFTYAQIPGASITWGVDPTDNTNLPVSNLTVGTQYNWSVTAQDANGNQVRNTTWYVP